MKWANKVSQSARSLVRSDFRQVSSRVSQDFARRVFYAVCRGMLFGVCRSTLPDTSPAVVVRGWQARALAGLVLAGAAMATDHAVASPSADAGTPAIYVEVNQIGNGRCVKDRCATLHIRTADFTQHPDFTQFLTRSLLTMAGSAVKTGQMADVAALMDHFVKTATPVTNEYLQANVLRNQSDLVVVELVHEIFSGGAHGETTSQYVNWLPTSNRVASLETMLLPDAMSEFEKILREQHQIWLKEQINAIDDLKSFEQSWPFKVSDNAALMPEGLTVTYERYVIGPGSFGQPSLVIPYSKLNNVLKPEFITAAMN